MCSGEAGALLNLLDWDGDNVFVFGTSKDLHVHIDRGEDWLRPEQPGSRQMLYIVNTVRI